MAEEGDKEAIQIVDKYKILNEMFIPEEIKELALYSFVYSKYWEDAGYPFVVSTEKRGKREIKKVDYDKLEGWLIKRYCIVSFNKILYIYKDGMYRENKGEIEESIKKILMREGLTKEKTIRNITTEILQRIEWSTFFREFPFNTLKSFIPLKNGVLFRGERYLLLPNSPIYGYTWCLPVNYDEKAECPKIDKFLSELVKKEDVKVLYEIPALCLMDAKYDRAFMLFGGGNNGKSTYLNLLIRFLGEDNVSNVSLQDLAHDKFKAYQLVGKLANIFADIPKKPLKYTGVFKMLVSGDRITVERKFKDPFEFRNKATLIFSANELPETNDMTDAFWRRWNLIEFPNKFKEIPGFLDNLLTEEELSGFLNRVLLAMTRIEELGLTITNTMERIKEEWLSKANSVYAFVKEKIELDSTGYVTKKDLYSAYVVFCDDNSLTTRSKKSFGDEIQRLIPEIRDGTKRIMGKMQRVWLGIRLKEDSNGSEIETTDLPEEELDLSKF
jgi:putative DNA primase/helicase